MIANLPPRAKALIEETFGIPYVWGAGTPSTPWPAAGYDCSGFVQGALVRLGYMSPSQPDRTAAGLAMCCDVVPIDEVRLGDLAFYGKPVSHVMLVVGAGWVYGATGGRSTTKGDNLRAYVRLERTHYRNDLLVFGRLKPEYRTDNYTAELEAG